MFLVIVAVTKTYDGFCVAGINASGIIVRPICGKGRHRFWSREQLTHDGDFIKCGDIWEVEGVRGKREFPNHTEDLFTSKLVYSHTINHEWFIKILDKFAGNEKTFLNTVYGRKRSLCLISVKSIVLEISHWHGNPRFRIGFTGKFSLENPKTKDKMYPVKDCKWVGLISKDFKLPNFKKIFVCIGLATPSPFDRVEYPQVVGLHTSPNVAFPDNYPG